MHADRFVATQFCDDVRHEVGNKFSLIGCYGTQIDVRPLPSVLPKLCAQIKIYTPIGRPFQKLVVRLFRDDKVIGELPFATESLIMPAPDREGCTWHVAIAMMIISPFAVDAPCALRVEAETEDGVVPGGIVWINAAPQTAAPLTPTQDAAHILPNDAGA